jgi:hypothetical protein
MRFPITSSAKGKTQATSSAPKLKNGFLHLTRCDQHALTFEAVIGTAHDEHKTACHPNRVQATLTKTESIQISGGR